MEKPGPSRSASPKNPPAPWDPRRSQKLNFRPNWISRGETEVVLITPKLAALASTAGFENWGWLKTLKNCARNSMLVASVGALI